MENFLVFIFFCTAAPLPIFTAKPPILNYLFNYRFSTEQETLMQYANIPAISCPEILIDGEDIKVYDKVMNNVSIFLY